MRRVPVLALLLAWALPAAGGQYLDPQAWAEAVERPLRRAELRMMPGYAVEFRDSFGTWHPGERDNPVDLGNGQVMDRRYAPEGAFLLPPGNWGGGFTCFSFVYPCLGINGATYTLPYRIIGITGQLRYTADQSLGFRRGGIDWFDNAAFDQTAGPGATYDGFFGALFDTTTRSIDMNWLAPLSDLYSGFSLTEVQVLVRVRRDEPDTATMRRAPPVAVPEPASALLLGAGLLGLGLLRLAGRRAARPRPSTARPVRAIP